MKKIPFFYAPAVLFLFFLGAVILKGSPTHGPVYGQPPDIFFQVGFLCLVFAVGAGYIFPSVIAVCRKHPNWPGIVVLNLALGWTFLGWVGSLIWSLVNPTNTESMPPPNTESMPPPIPHRTVRL